MSQLDIKKIVDKYFSNGRFFEALDIESLHDVINNAAKKGDPKAQYLMGLFYMHRNPKLSLSWFQKSAAQFFDKEFLKAIKGTFEK